MAYYDGIFMMAYTEGEALAFRYRTILDRISAAAESSNYSHEITLIAVSKKQSCDAIEALYHLGHRDFGENYAQEMIAKAKEL